MIIWTQGPPPAEWRDKRQVAVIRDGFAMFVQWDDDFEWFAEPSWFGDEEITHHAAANGPG